MIAPDLLDSICDTTLAEIGRLPHTYHSRVHTEKVMARSLELGQDSGLNEYELQQLYLAALFHDYGHAGQAYRQLTSGIDHPNLSNEEYAALKADEFLAPYLSVPQRLEIQGMILGTTFMQGNRALFPPTNGIDLYRDYAPNTKLEKLIAFADINSLVSPDEEFIDEHFQLIKECTIATMPANYDVWLKGRAMFLAYQRSRLEIIKPYLTKGYIDLLEIALARREAACMLQGDYHRNRALYEDRFHAMRADRLRELEGDAPTTSRT